MTYGDLRVYQGRHVILDVSELNSSDVNADTMTSFTGSDDVTGSLTDFDEEDTAELQGDCNLTLSSTWYRSG